jgi:tetratricopeptide (TPR) repeat protein
MDDRYGLPMSTSSTRAAERCSEGLDLLLENNYGPEEKFQQAVDSDEGFALAQAYAAYMWMLRAQVPKARESAAGARSHAAGISRREQRLVEAVSLWADGKGPLAMPMIKEHLAEFPRDMFMLRLAQRLYVLGCNGAGVPDFPEQLFALAKSVEQENSGDWAFLGLSAFAHHETGRVDEALPLAERSLQLRPSNAVAAHSVAHVFFEKGNHGEGADFMGSWLPGFDKRASYHVHLSWHHALFELAMGRYQQALDLYQADIRPAVVDKSITALNDSASLLWRLQVYAGAPPPFPWQEVRDQGTPAAERPGPAFRDAHAALAFAGGGDESMLGRLIDRLRTAAKGGDRLAAEVTLPLVEGIGAFARGEYGAAVGFLEPVFPQLTRIGGSHAQREVFEETLLEGYLRAERFDKAEEMLQSRLRRRESVRDLFWLGRAQSNAGRQDKASANLSAAKQGWRGADPASPEFNALCRLVGKES